MPAHKTKKPAADKRGGVVVPGPKGETLTQRPQRRGGTAEPLSFKDADDLWAAAAHALLDGHVGAAKEEVPMPTKAPAPKKRP